MRALWFCNVPTYDVWRIDRHDEPHHGGWIDSLKNAMLSSYPDLELGIAFPAMRLRKRLAVGRVTLFPILYRRSILVRGFTNWRHLTDPLSTISICTEIVRWYKPDIVHVFGTEMVFGSLIPEIDVPTTIHLQGLLTVYSRMWFRGISPWRHLRHQRFLDFLLGRGYIHDYLRIKKAARRERDILGNCRSVIGRTDWDRRVSSILAPHARYFHCDETMRREFWEKEWHPPKRQERVLFSTFNGAIYKGLETLLEAFNLVRMRYGDCVILKIAGIGCNDRVVSLSRKVLSLKRDDARVVYLGSVNAGEVANELAEADVFVHPSHIDNSPNSICEAMLVGTPLVSTNAGGIPSIVVNNEQGLLVQDGDAIAMAAAIMELLSNEAFAGMLSRSARACAQMRHAPEQISAIVYSIYSQMLQK